MGDQTLYDALPYRSNAYQESHIDRLYTVAHLFGAEPKDVGCCRVLEIGCADGGNLVPMAVHLPESTFIGIDLASTQIDAGREWVEPLALTNLKLIAGDFRDLPVEEGEFDYIIVHGVYSWIPVSDRVPLLQFVQDRLSARGVAYISYNTFPGWNTRNTIRSFLRQHINQALSPEQRGEQANTLIRFLYDANVDEDPYGKLIRRQCKSLFGAPTQYVVHGLLAEHNYPLYFHEFLREAEQASLAYLGDADFGSMLPDRLPEHARAAMDTVPGGLREQEQVQDFLVNRSFRRSLLVSKELELHRSIPWERVEDLWMSTPAALVDGKIEGDAEASFDAPAHVFVTDNRILKVGIQVLRAHWPRNLSFLDWVAKTVEASGEEGVEVRSMLGRNVLLLFSRGVLRVHPRDLKITKNITSCPYTDPWTRRRAELFQWVTDPRHRMHKVPAIPRFVLRNCNGLNTHQDLQQLLTEAHRHGRLTLEDGAARALQIALSGLAERALLKKTPV